MQKWKSWVLWKDSKFFWSRKINRGRSSITTLNDRILDLRSTDRLVKCTIMRSQVYDHINYTIFLKFTILNESIRFWLNVNQDWRKVYDHSRKVYDHLLKIYNLRYESKRSSELFIISTKNKIIRSQGHIVYSWSYILSKWL